jgi:large subunit ribosomal protein L3|tara:strand:+ start:1118 stop:1738 length:621 start_codon:yes stop_codon:yes gene_type:complete
MYGLIGKKIKMTQIFNDDGHVVPVTLVEAGPCTVSQIKNENNAGYNAVQLAYGQKSKKKTNKPMSGHLSKSGVETAKVIAEFKSIVDFDYKLGQKFDSSIFNVGEVIDVRAKSKGKGFAGTIKRHNFARQDATHGNKHTERAPGSIGQASWPSRVFKGMKMAGRKGSDNVTVQNLEIVDIDKENNLLFIKGAIPGANNAPVFLLKK